MSTAKKLHEVESLPNIRGRDDDPSLLENPFSAWLSFLERVPKMFFENQPGGENAKKFIEAIDAAKYLGGRYTEGAVRMKTHRQEIPFFKVGSDVYYTTETLEMWKLLHFKAPKLVR